MDFKSLKYESIVHYDHFKIKMRSVAVRDKIVWSMENIRQICIGHDFHLLTILLISDFLDTDFQIAIKLEPWGLDT